MVLAGACLAVGITRSRHHTLPLSVKVVYESSPLSSTLSSFGRISITPAKSGCRR